MSDAYWRYSDSRQQQPPAVSSLAGKRPRSDYDVQSGREMPGYYSREEERLPHRTIRDTESIDESYDRYLRSGQNPYGGADSSRLPGSGMSGHPVDDLRTANESRMGNDHRMASDSRMGNDHRMASDSRMGNDHRMASDSRMGNDHRMASDPRSMSDLRMSSNFRSGGDFRTGSDPRISNVGMDHGMPVKERGSNLGSGRPEVSLPPDASSTLFVEGLPSKCTDREVAHIFRPFIGYKEVRLVTKESRHPRGDPLVLCFVDFMSPPHAATALDALQGYKFDEKDRDSTVLRLQFARYPGSRSGGGHRGKR